MAKRSICSNESLENTRKLSLKEKEAALERCVWLAKLAT